MEPMTIGMIRDALGELYKELLEQEIPARPDYNRQGVQVLFDCLAQLAALSYRASAIQAKARILKSMAEDRVAEVREDYQSRYDTEVVRRSNNLPHLSWEERASHYRTGMIDAEIAKRNMDRASALCTALVEAIDLRARAVQKARNDLAPLVDIMKMGEKLGEIA